MSETIRTPEMLSNEHAWATEALNRGECAVAYFQGQTGLYIPKHWIEKLGPNAEEIIKKLLSEVYGAQIAEEEFSALTPLQKSFFIELPSETNWQKQYEPFGKVAEFIEKLRTA